MNNCTENDDGHSGICRRKIKKVIFHLSGVMAFLAMVMWSTDIVGLVGRVWLVIVLIRSFNEDNPPLLHRTVKICPEAIGILLFCVAYMVLIGLLEYKLFPSSFPYYIQKPVFLRPLPLMTNVITSIMWALLSVIWSPIWEELFFTHLIYGGLIKKRVSQFGAIFVACGLFALMHINSSQGFPLAMFIYYCLLRMLLISAYLKRGLESAIVCHSILNSLSSAFGYLGFFLAKCAFVFSLSYAAIVFFVLALIVAIFTASSLLWTWGKKCNCANGNT